MTVTLLRAKLHRVRVTEACLDYVGSLTVDADLMDAAGLYPHEKILCANVEYTAKTGFMPPSASPAANVAACSSAMPTSKNLSGNFFANSESPVPSVIAAETAQILSSFSARAHSASPNAAENPPGFG